MHSTGASFKDGAGGGIEFAYDSTLKLFLTDGIEHLIFTSTDFKINNSIYNNASIKVKNPEDNIVTTDSSLSTFTLGLGDDNTIPIPTDEVHYFKCIVTAIATNGDVAVYEIKGAIKNILGITTIVGTPTVTTIVNDTGASSWSANAVANDTLNTLEINVTGEVGRTINWKAKLEII